MYHGEADTSAVAVTATRNYAYKGQYTSLDTAISVAYTKTDFSHNIGTTLLRRPTFWLRNYTRDDGAHNVGTILIDPLASSGAANIASPSVQINNRNSISILTGNQAANWLQTREDTGAINGITATSWKMYLTAERAF
jgi:hypothetical protein